MVDIFFAISSNEFRTLLKEIPIKTGIVTIKNIFKAMSINEIPSLAKFTPKKEREIPRINGIVTTLKILITAVKEIDKATSPLAKEVNKFDVTPPGAAAIIITPRANSIGVLNILIRAKAIIGSKIIWQIKPIMKSLGFLVTLIKS